MVVDHNVEMAEMAYRLGYHRVTFRRVAHVNDEHLARAAKFANVVAHGFEMCGVTAGDQDRRATDGEFASDRDTNSGAAAGYHGDLTLDAEYVFQSKKPPELFHRLGMRRPPRLRSRGAVDFHLAQEHAQRHTAQPGSFAIDSRCPNFYWWECRGRPRCARSGE